MSRPRKKKGETTLLLKKGNGFFPSVHRMIRSDKYKALSNSEKVVLQYICSHYNGVNGTAADPIICPYDSIPLQSVTIAKALKALAADEWITYITFGGVMRNPNRYAFGPTFLGYY